MRIALVEDDIDQSEVLSFWLNEAEHDTSEFFNGASLLDAMGKQYFDLYIVDWILPDMNGGEVIRQIRAQVGWNTPVLVTTVLNKEQDIVEGLSSGADDYLCKPVKQGEFIARIEALTRRLRARAQPVLRVGSYELDSEQQRVRVHGTKIELTQKEFDLAWYLISNPGTLFSRNQLLDKIWGVSADVDTRTVDTHVSRLRRKLSLNESNGWKLESIYGYGYRLEALSQDQTEV